MTQPTRRFKSLRYLFLAGAVATIPLSNNFATAQLVTAPVTASTAIAQSTEQTLLLCETNNTAIRIYQEGADTFMRAFNRQQSRVFMDNRLTELGDMPNATTYRNLLSELSVTVLASKSADDCSITISNQPAEDGRLLVDNRLTDSPQITPIETPADTAVTGTLSYRTRIRLLPGAVVTTQLVNLTEGSVIAEQTITTTGE
ncbi:MAG: YbaY family lipoprotein, partial [Cyanobacteria bacterium P01_A01_bin.17]